MPNFAVQRLEFLPSNIRRIASISQEGMREVERINKQQIDRMIEKARRALWVIGGKPIGVLGLAFKPNTDDVCFSSADWERVHAVMARPLVLDGRNLLKGEVLKSLGFEYESFGRPDLAEETLPSVA